MLRLIPVPVDERERKVGQGGIKRIPLSYIFESLRLLYICVIAVGLEV